MKYETILVKTDSGVGILRLNREKALNALNETLLIELMDALQTFDSVNEIGAMVITGNDKVFAAGADIKQMATYSAVEILNSKFLSLFDKILDIRKPIIAAVSGWCLGGGNELAMSCDMIIASDTAKFGQPEINLGVIPGAGGTQRLTKAVGKVIAMEMVLNNRTLSAAEAQQYGLINYVYPIENYFEKAVELARQIAERAPVAVQMGKEAVNLAYETTLSQGLERERSTFNFLFATEDQKEGMKAFIDKRKPTWLGY